MFTIISIHWDERNKGWIVDSNKCKIKSNKKNIVEISVSGILGNIFIHKEIFDFLKIYYPSEYNSKDYVNIDWAAYSLRDCIFFIENNNDLYKGLSYFYRNLEKVEINENLNGNKIDYFIDRSSFSHGFFYSFSSTKKLFEPFH